MVQPRTTARKIPGLVPGIFFMLVAASAAASSELELAADLYAEGQWAAARVEGLRVQAAAAGPAADRAGLLAAVSALRLGTDRAAALQDLEALWRAESADLESRCLAAYEFGLADWAAGGAQAPAALEFAYVRTRETPLFWRAGCSLYFYLKTHKKLRREKAATVPLVLGVKFTLTRAAQMAAMAGRVATSCFWRRLAKILYLISAISLTLKPPTVVPAKSATNMAAMVMI